MSVVIKSLTNGVPTGDLSTDNPVDYFNILEKKDTIYTLYTALAPSGSTTLRAAIVKSIRVVNTSATQTVKVTLYFNRPVEDGVNSRRRLLTPLDMPMAPNSVYIDDSEITLEPGDMIQAKTDTDKAVQYLISGVERDV